MEELYWISVLSKLQIIGTTIAAIGGTILILVGAFVWSDDDDYEKRGYKKFSKIMVPITIIALALAVFIPNKKDMYLIYGIGTVVDYIQDNEDAKEIPDKTIQLINKTLDNLLEEEDNKSK